MSLCAICREIPWRSLRSDDAYERTEPHTFSKLATAAGESFSWCNKSGQPVEAGDDSWPFIRHQTSKSELNERDDKCTFCHLVTSAVRDPIIQPTYHGGFKLKQKNFYGEAWKEKPIWTQLPRSTDSRPLCRLWIGDSRPEHFIRTIEPQVTVDCSFSQAWPRVVLQDPFHATVRKQMRCWLDQCDAEHSQCLNRADWDSLLPTRILDLGSLPTSDEIVARGDSWRELFHEREVRLVETLPGQRGPYVALSYCWGSSLPCKTTKVNLGTHINGLDIGGLPKTLQDSIIVTRVLGIRYIWIDCLCIIQDDKGDWERESARMAGIYSQCYLAIAATRARHCDQGILAVRSKSPEFPITFHDDLGAYDLYFYQKPRGLGDSEEFINQLEPLQRRAWVFQERILAPRTLHFGTDQLYWECGAGLISEDGFGSFDPRDTSFEHSLEHIAEELKDTTSYRRLSATKWARLVRSYTALDITYQSDRLPALSGIIATLQHLTGDTCYAGLWKGHFLNGLLWHADTSSSSFPHAAATKLTFYRAPSWSFLAFDATMSYFVDLRWADMTTHHVAQLIDCDVMPLGQNNNSLGELKAGGFARIAGPVTTVEALLPQCTTAGTGEYWNRVICMRDGARREAMVRFDFEAEERDYADVLMVTSNVGLLIRRVGEERAGDGDEWVRIGIVEVLEENEGVEMEFVGFEPSLGVESYPAVKTITLL